MSSAHHKLWLLHVAIAGLLAAITKPDAPRYSTRVLQTAIIAPAKPHRLDIERLLFPTLTVKSATVNQPAPVTLLSLADTSPTAPNSQPARNEVAFQKSCADILFSNTNLVAWCIVPFDAAKRDAEQRAAMLEKLGFTQFAYDYRAEHIPAFDAEVEALQRHHVRLMAWWFPTTLNDEGRNILSVLDRHHLRGVQLWVMGGGEPTATATEQQQRVTSEAARIRPIALAATKHGSQVALYNHGGWFGEPENQLAIIDALSTEGITNVGIVYNLHHGHSHLDRFASLLQKMKPHLLALNLNGMVRDGDKNGNLIMPLGQGELDVQLLRTICESGWRGPMGLLNHTDKDAEARLLDNLDGLRWIKGQLKGESVPRPKPRSWP